MLINFISWIIILIICGLGFKYLKNMIDKAKSIYEKILIILLFILFMIPIILYIVDSYNVPTKLKFDDFVDLNRWSNFIFNYAVTVGGCALSGGVLLIITLYQIESQNKSNKEDKRINNLPIIDYDIKLYCDNTSIRKINLCKENTSRLVEFFIELENLGMNIVRKSFINIKTDLLDDDYDYMLSNRGIIKKDGKNGLIFRIPIDGDEFDAKFTIKYQDILFNWYQQEVLVNFKEIRYMKIIGTSSKISIDVKDEIKLNEDIVLNIK